MVEVVRASQKIDRPVTLSLYSFNIYDVFVRREVETREKATRESAKKVVTVHVWQIKEVSKRE